MKLQGTVSVLVGCHSLVHGYYTRKAWKALYGSSPAFWEGVCILVHDWGHWNTNYLDNLAEKEGHWRLGAKIAGRLFGQKGYALVAGHCTYSGYPQSKLYKADKLSWHLAPYWWIVLNNFTEPKIAMGYGKREGARRFKEQVRRSIESGEYRGTHELYLERCRGKVQ